jgi:excisionase family DNA binding protein
MGKAVADTPDDEWLLTVPEAAAQLRISRSHFFKLKRRGVIETVKLGSRTVVPRREIARLIDEAMDAAGTEKKPAKRRKTPA